jgi:hypothetical protein
MHICEPDKAVSFKQSQAINMSVNSETQVLKQSPVAFNPEMFVARRKIINVTI